MEVRNQSLSSLIFSEGKVDFKQSIIAAKEAFNSYESRNGVEKQQFISDLKEIYQVMPKTAGPEEAALFHLYGRTVYGGDMTQSRTLFELSLAIQFASLHIFEEYPSFFKTDSLDTVAKKMSKNEILTQQDKFLLETSPKEFLDKLHSANADEEDKFLCARNLRWLGHSFQNIDAFSSNTARLEQIYNLVYSILEDIHTPESDWEGCELHYNTDRHIHHLKTPGDSLGALATLEKLKPYIEKENGSLRSIEKQAQIYNITAIEMGPLVKSCQDPQEKARLLREQFNFIQKAAEMAEETPGFNTRLKTMFLHNRAAQAQACEKLDVEMADTTQIRKWHESVLEDMKSQDYNYYYHAQYILNAAEFELQTGNEAKAREYFILTLKVALKYPDSTTKIILQVAPYVLNAGKFEMKNAKYSKALDCFNLTLEAAKKFPHHTSELMLELGSLFSELIEKSRA